MSKIELFVDEQMCECDECGWYESDTWTILKDGEEVASLHYDGHFGGGDLNIHEPSEAAAAVLKALGFEVEVTRVERER
jgi:hypothetical protein